MPVYVFVYSFVVVVVLEELREERSGGRRTKNNGPPQSKIKQKNKTFVRLQYEARRNICFISTFTELLAESSLQVILRMLQRLPTI